MPDLGIAIVTPSFNQGKFLAAALDSVLNQNFRGLQYVVMDGGSSDGSVDLIRERAGLLVEWRSGDDGGQYEAINNGFAATDAPIMGWLNADDMHLPWALSLVAEIFGAFPKVRWLTTRFPIRWDEAGRAVNCSDVRGYSRRGMMRGENMPGSRGFTTWPIQQESTFWRRDLWEEAGGRLDTTLSLAADFDLWMRFAKLTEPVSISVPLAGFRRHGEQKTSKFSAIYAEQAMQALVRNGGKMQRGVLRSFSRDRLPSALQSIALKFGFLHRALVISRSRDNMRWVMTEVAA
jgi:glycosyltransferase involved in cell wall biosynthesis